MLKEALGVELNQREKKLIGWIASNIEPLDAETLVSLFRRSRGAEPVAPVDPWAECDDVVYEIVECQTGPEPEDFVLELSEVQP